MMEKDAKIYVAGHRGMVGSAIVRALEKAGYHNIVTRTHKELNLCRQQDVEDFFAAEKPDYVFLAAAKVGGIVANQEALADFDKAVALAPTAVNCYLTRAEFFDQQGNFAAAAADYQQASRLVDGDQVVISVENGQFFPHVPFFSSGNLPSR